MDGTLAQPDQGQRGILFMDAHDSFSNNIVALLRKLPNTTVTIIKIDKVESSPDTGDRSLAQRFLMLLREHDAVVVGPGPGNPKNGEDVGLIQELWSLPKKELPPPVLGICLGLQSMALSAGAEIQRLQAPRHGIITQVIHNASSIFSDVGDIKATQYHSLHVVIGHDVQTERGVMQTNDLWKPSTKCPLLEPLAWDLSDPTNGAVLMAAKHRCKPFWGVQYHPESICTDSEGAKIIENWWKEVQPLIHERRARLGVQTGTPLDWMHPELTPEEMARMNAAKYARRDFDTLYQASPPSEVCGLLSKSVQWKSLRAGSLNVDNICNLMELTTMDAVVLESGLKENGDPLRSDTGRFSIIGLCGYDTTLQLHYNLMNNQIKFQYQDEEAVLDRYIGDFWSYLASFMEQFRVPGGPSISPFWGGLMGFVTYEAGLATIDVVPPRHSNDRLRPDICFALVHRSIVIDHVDKTIFVQSINVDDGFWVETMSWILKRAVLYDKLHSMETGPINWALSPAARDVVIGFEPQNEFNAIYADMEMAEQHTTQLEGNLQNCQYEVDLEMGEEDGRHEELSTDGDASSIHSNDHRDDSSTVSDKMSRRSSNTSVTLDPHEPEEVISAILTRQEVIPAYLGEAQLVKFPSQAKYYAKVRKCRKHIRAGDSYELCLTNRSVVSLPKLESAQTAYILYRELAKSNPAPFGAYMRLGLEGHGVSILSSSPERFLSWNRDGICQYRPIKGTVGKGPNVTREYAENILGSSKERAENLMIVDLIRHDLRGVVGPGNVRVTKLMDVEEYETVYQLVSVIEGDLHMREFANNEDTTKHPCPPTNRKSGIDVLAASLPPGSMTGAPKKRSCELLKEIEYNKPRGIYSGVLGYFDVGGGGDFSVVIRSAVKWDDGEPEDPPDMDVWRVGAGGAVTSQSNPADEYSEMLAKANSTLQMFGIVVYEVDSAEA